MNQNRPYLKILLSNHHLMSYQGSENFTFVIASFLKRKGHDVTIYSAYIGELRKDFEAIGVSITSDLRLIQGQSFDIAHVHHQINVLEVRHYFPSLPIILLCHGIVFLENPPPFDLKISQYRATSEQVLAHMVKQGVQKEKIILFRNMVDSEKFFPRSIIHEQPRNALILSNKIDVKNENVIKQACAALNIKTCFIGNRFRQVGYHEIPSLINEADIVFSLGRGAIEAMLCDRIPVIFDYEGGDGMVTPDSFIQNITCNFSGNLYNINYTVEQLIIILKQYQPGNGIKLREKAKEYFAAGKQIERLIDIYYSYVNTTVDSIDLSQKLILNSFVSSIAETRNYSLYAYNNYMQAAHAHQSTQTILSRIKRRLFRVVRCIFSPFFRIKQAQTAS